MGTLYKREMTSKKDGCVAYLVMESFNLDIPTTSNTYSYY